MADKGMVSERRGEQAVHRREGAAQIPREWSLGKGPQLSGQIGKRYRRHGCISAKSKTANCKRHGKGRAGLQRRRHNGLSCHRHKADGLAGRSGSCWRLPGAYSASAAAAAGADTAGAAGAAAAAGGMAAMMASYKKYIMPREGATLRYEGREAA